MSSTTKLPKFVVYAPDYTEPGTLAKRYSVRPKHLEEAKLRIDSGVYQVAGAMTTPDSIDLVGEERKIVGSIFIVKAENIDQVREMMEADVYYTRGVWDKEKLTILPFFAATPFPE